MNEVMKWMTPQQHIEELDSIAADNSLDGTYIGKLLRGYLDKRAQNDLVGCCEEEAKISSLPECSAELRAILNLDASLLMVHNGQIPQARIRCAKAYRTAEHELGHYHRLTLQLRRHELHWMSLTRMEDIALRRYRQLLADIEQSQGRASELLWTVCLESTIPLVHIGFHSQCFSRLQRCIDAIRTTKGQAHWLRYEAGLWMIECLFSMRLLERAAQMCHEMMGWETTEEQEKGSTGALSNKTIERNKGSFSYQQRLRQWDEILKTQLAVGELSPEK